MQKSVFYLFTHPLSLSSVNQKILYVKVSTEVCQYVGTYIMYVGMYILDRTFLIEYYRSEVYTNIFYRWYYRKKHCNHPNI